MKNICMSIIFAVTVTVSVLVQNGMGSEENVSENMAPKDNVLFSENTFEELVKNVRELQENLNHQNRRISFLEREVEVQNTKIEKLQTLCDRKGSKPEILKESGTTAYKLAKNLSFIIDNSVEFKTEVSDENSLKIKNQIGKYGKRTRNILSNTKRFKRNADGFAFSAYLSHTMSHLTPGHTIKYDKVLLNDGNGYNPFTGVFTVPTTGVYLFTFYFDSYAGTHLKLLIDGKYFADIVADPTTHTQEIMGGNTIIVRVSSGQSVWIEEYGESDGQAVGGHGYRFTTFSGFLLY